MTAQKWHVYEVLKQLVEKAFSILESDEQLWQQHEKICAECELAAEKLCEE